MLEMPYNRSGLRMNERPVPSRGFAEWLLEAIGAALLVALVAFACSGSSGLPRTVPTHFDFSGVPDTWGHPSTLLVLPALTLALYAGLTLLQAFPRFYNYPGKVSAENAARVQRVGRQTVLATKVFLVAALTYVFHESVRVARGELDGLSRWFAPAFTVALSLLLGGSVLRMRRVR